MELLMAVAIIAVMLVIFIPVMTRQLEKVRETADAASIRSAYGDAVQESLSSGGLAASAESAEMTQWEAGWIHAGDLLVGDRRINEIPEISAVKSGDVVVVSVQDTTASYSVIKAK